MLPQTIQDKLTIALDKARKLFIENVSIYDVDVPLNTPESYVSDLELLMNNIYRQLKIAGDSRIDLSKVVKLGENNISKLISSELYGRSFLKVDLIKDTALHFNTRLSKRGVLKEIYLYRDLFPHIDKINYSVADYIQSSIDERFLLLEKVNFTKTYDYCDKFMLRADFTKEQVRSVTMAMYELREMHVSNLQSFFDVEKILPTWGKELIAQWYLQHKSLMHLIDPELSESYNFAIVSLRSEFKCDVFSHGDLSLQNLCFQNDKLYLCNWEKSQINMSMQDFGHFYMQLISYPELQNYYLSLIEDLFKNKQLYLEFISAVCVRICIQFEHIFDGLAPCRLMSYHNNDLNKVSMELTEYLEKLVFFARHFHHEIIELR